MTYLSHVIFYNKRLKLYSAAQIKKSIITFYYEDPYKHEP